MKHWFLISAIFFLLVFSFGFRATASHIVGGEVYYKCINGNSKYQVELSIYQDCIEGDDSAIKADVPAYIGVFNLATGFGSVLTVNSASSISVPPNFRNECVNNPPATCLNKVTFVFETNLQPDVPYRIIYLRCCRNASIQNIQQPGTTGVTYYCDIPANIASCNNSAVFKNYPPQIICINNPLSYDHSATDIDGDSLSYEFCEAYQGGVAGIYEPKPKNFDATLPPPVNYTGIYSSLRPMGGKPVIQIDHKTGLITGTPNVLGRYVVTVCCHEWRNGNMINTVRREFQFNVTNCSKAVVAKMPQFSEEDNTYIVKCDGYKVKFVNESSGGFSYKWYFQYPNLNISSTDFEPEYTYPDTGTYRVKLVVNEGSTCPDSTSKIVKIYPYFSTDFDIEGLHCPGQSVQFTDRSVATLPPVVAWRWDFGDGATSGMPNPQHTYSNGGNYDVRLITTSVKGCKDTASKQMQIEYFKAFAGNDTVIVKGEYIDFHASGGIEYLWTPSDVFNSAVIPNPRAYFPDTGLYAFNVHVKSAVGCEGDDSIKVLVVPDPYLFVPSAFTPNRDGLNDILKPLGAGYRNVRFFRVFNRWGQLMFQTTHFNEGWDGTLNGQIAEMGTYFWVLGVTDRFGKEEMIKGDVTLIR